MKEPIFTGSSVAIITPFGQDGKVDYKKFGELIDMQIKGGTKAITVCGTTGESATQTLEEHMETVDFCVRYVNHRCKVIAGAGSNDTMAALMLAQEAEKSGADALLMVTPYYNKATQRGLIKHYTYLADRVHTPIILYNVPSRTGCSFTVDTYKVLSQHPMINGIKEASGNFALLGDTLAACGDDMNIWSGNDDEVVPMMSLGAKGVISVVANVDPEVMAKLTKLCLDNDFRAAAELQLRYLDLCHKLFIEVNPIPVKAAMNLMGMEVGECRLPLCEMDPANVEKLRASMQAVGLIQ